MDNRLKEFENGNIEYYDDEIMSLKHLLKNNLLT